MRAHSLQPICSTIVLLIKLLGITLSSLCLISITTMLKVSFVLFFWYDRYQIAKWKIPHRHVSQEYDKLQSVAINFFLQCMGSPYAGAIMTQD